MICKNEAEMLAGCLDSVRDAVDEIVIVDTGSTDSTIEIARGYGAKIISTTWVDFSTARNRSLEATSMDWVFVLDADEELVTEKAQVLRELADSAIADAFSFHVINVKEMTEFIQVDEARLFTAVKLFKRQGVKYKNPIHEQVLLPSGVRPEFVPEPLVVHYGYLKEIYDAREKASRNAELIRGWRQSEPDNPWAKFYLARDVLLKEGRFSQAAELFESAQSKLIAAGSTLLAADTFIHLVTCYEELGSPDRVEDVFKRGVNVFPEYIENRYFYGCFLLKSGEIERAIGQFGECLQLNETDARFYSTVRGSSNWRSLRGLSDAFTRLGEIERAIIARSLADRVCSRSELPTTASGDMPLSVEGRRLMSAIRENGLAALDEVADFLLSKGDLTVDLPSQ